jgi:hypothetical protein
MVSLVSFRAAAAFALVSLAACGSGTGQPGATAVSPNTTASLDEAFALAPGQAVTVGALSLTVRFDSVTADSRCPASVQCVWAGDGAVHLTVTRSGAVREVDLHTTLDPQTLSETGYTLTLVALDPAKATADPIPAASYRATLIVRAGS